MADEHNPRVILSGSSNPNPVIVGELLNFETVVDIKHYEYIKVDQTLNILPSYVKFIDFTQIQGLPLEFTMSSVSSNALICHFNSSISPGMYVFRLSVIPLELARDQAIFNYFEMHYFETAGIIREVNITTETKVIPSARWRPQKRP